MRPRRKRQRVVLATVFLQLHDGFDEVLLMRLTKSEPIQPAKMAQLVEFDCLARLGQHHENAFNLLARTEPPWAQTRGVMAELQVSMFGQRGPGTWMGAAFSQDLFSQLPGEGCAHGETAKPLYASLTLLKIQRARA